MEDKEPKVHKDLKVLKVQKDHKEPKVIQEVHQEEPKVHKEVEEDKELKDL